MASLRIDVKFVDSIDSKYKCNYCKKRLHDPQQVKCGHRYCKPCIDQLLKEKAKDRCPACREEDDQPGAAFRDPEEQYDGILVPENVFADNAIRREIGRLKCLCPYAKPCDWTGLYQSLEEHVKNQCKYAPVACELNCGQLVARNALAVHKEVECMERLVQCEHCNMKPKAKDKENHLRVCENLPVICSGCLQKMGQAQLAAHQDLNSGTCTRQYVPCPYGCKDQLNKDNMEKHKERCLVTHVDIVHAKYRAVEEQLLPSKLQQSQLPLQRPQEQQQPSRKQQSDESRLVEVDSSDEGSGIFNSIPEGGNGNVVGAGKVTSSGGNGVGAKVTSSGNVGGRFGDGTKSGTTGSGIGGQAGDSGYGSGIAGSGTRSGIDSSGPSGSAATTASRSVIGSSDIGHRADDDGIGPSITGSVVSGSSKKQGNSAHGSTGGIAVAASSVIRSSAGPPVYAIGAPFARPLARQQTEGTMNDSGIAGSGTGDGLASGGLRQGDTSRPTVRSKLSALKDDLVPNMVKAVEVLSHETKGSAALVKVFRDYKQRQLEHTQLMEEKVKAIERRIQIKENRLVELATRLEMLEQVQYDGILVWRITEFSRKRKDAVSGKATQVTSCPFFTSPTGYKMCARAYLNGDASAKGSHVSIFFVLMKGPYDAILKWPFNPPKVTIMLLDQTSPKGSHIKESFLPDSTSQSFKRPTEMNVPVGCPQFYPLKDLEDPNRGYLKEDSIFIKMIVDKTT